MKKYLLVTMLSFAFCFIAVGCGKISSITLEVDCNGKSDSLTLKKGDTFECTLLNDEYEFTVSKIEKNQVTLKASDYGLAPVKEEGGVSLLDKVNEFSVEKDNELLLRTQTTDYSEGMKVVWK